MTLINFSCSVGLTDVLSVWTRLDSCSGLCYSPHLQEECYPTYTAQYEGRSLNEKRENIKGNIIASCDRFGSMWTTFVTKHLLLNPVDFSFVRGVGGRKVIIVNVRNVLFFCLQYLSASHPFFSLFFCHSVLLAAPFLLLSLVLILCVYISDLTTSQYLYVVQG